MSIRFDQTGPVILPFGEACALRQRRARMKRTALFAGALTLFLLKLGAIT